MDYQEFGPERALEAIEIYGRNGWQDYLSQRDLIGRALDASLYTCLLYTSPSPRDA